MPSTSHTFAFDTIYVIESLPDGDLKTGRQLHDDVLLQLTYGTNIRVEFRSIDTAAELTAHLDRIRHACLSEHRGPLIHLEAHGALQGVELANGEFLPWSDFARQMGEINAACRLNLFFVMAACRGGYLATVLKVTDVASAWAILGPMQDVDSAPLFLAMKTFYELMLQDAELGEALRAMNGEDGRADLYRIISAELLFWRAFRQYLEVSDAANIETRVNDAVAKVVARRGLDLVQSAATRVETRARMMDHRASFDRLRARFLMLDRFPDNASRFPLTYDDLLRIQGVPQSNE